MNFLNKLRQLFDPKVDTPPELPSRKHTIILPPEDDFEELETSDHDTDAAFPEKPKPRRQPKNSDKEILDGDLWGTTFAIEYRDSKGSESLRRIAMRHLVRKSDGRLILSANCYERNALRHFRFDRIISIVDCDGVVHDPIRFFEDELQSNVTEYMKPNAESPEQFADQNAKALKRKKNQTPPSGATNLSEKPGVAQRRVCRDGLRILAAIGRCDGDFHKSEISAIVDYVIEEADHEGFSSSTQDRKALTGYVMRLRPDTQILDKCIVKISGQPKDKMLRFLKAAECVIQADGQEHPAEIELLQHISVSFKELRQTHN